MRLHPDPTTGTPDPVLAAWARELSRSTVTPLDGGTVTGVVARIEHAVTFTATAAAAVTRTAATAAAVTRTAATAAAVTRTAATAAAVTPTGGATMTSAAITASTSAQAKVAAALTAALAAGTGAAATGHLPAGMQEFAADTALRIGVTLPRPEASATVAGHIELAIGEIVTVGEAGRIRVATTDEGLVLTGIEAAAGFSGSVLAETSESILVEFRSATETATVLVTDLDGELAAAVTGSAHASSESAAGVNASTDGDAEADGDAAVSGEAEVGIDLRIGG